MSDADDSSGGFPAALSDLKTGGAAVLVVGNVPDDCHRRASRRLLGATDGPPRRRVLAFTGHDVSAADGRLAHDAPRDETHLRVVHHDVGLRSQASTASTSTLPTVHVASEGLGELGAAIEGSVDDLEAATGEFDPAELRLCLDSVACLVETHDRSSVLAFLHLVADRVRRARGIGHFHLPVDREAEVVSTFVPLFDVTLELRVRDTRPEQRFHLQDGESSAWLPIDGR